MSGKAGRVVCGYLRGMDKRGQEFPERVSGLEGAKIRAVGARERSNQRRSGRKASSDEESSKSSWERCDGASWLRVERERLDSRQRRNVQRNVRHMLDEEDSKRNETWRDGVVRLLTRFDQFEVDLGMSPERWASLDVAFSGAFGGGVGSGFA